MALADMAFASAFWDGRSQRVLPRRYPEQLGFEREEVKYLKDMARPRRFERPTFAFGGQRSIQLSYGRLWASIDQTPASGNAPPHCKKARFL
jgi:hypothetical protein